MKKRCLMLLFLAMAMSGCAQKPNYTNVDKLVAEMDAKNAMEDKIISYIEDDITGYVNLDDLSVTLDDENSIINLHGRVIGFPDAIPCVSVALFPALQRAAEESGYSSTELQLMYYTDSNSGGSDSNSSVVWTTFDGQKGKLIADNSISTMTIDDLFSKYDNYGKK